MMSDMEYVDTHAEELSKYAGKWIVVFGNKVVAADEDGKKAGDEASKKHPGEAMIIMKILKDPPVLL